MSRILPAIDIDSARLLIKHDLAEVSMIFNDGTTYPIDLIDTEKTVEEWCEHENENPDDVEIFAYLHKGVTQKDLEKLFFISPRQDKYGYWYMPLGLDGENKHK